jgi:TRAP-type C4-dicarboxylate transport system substrate-binding protein
VRSICALLLVLGGTDAAHAKQVLRLATVAPEGTSWARQLNSLANEVEAATHGELGIKYYWGGMAGDEDVVAERVKKQQLDGVVSGGMLCQHVSPSMEILALPGIFQNGEEVAYVMRQLLPSLQAEAINSGYALLGTVTIGPDVLFSRQPVRTMADFRKTRWWRWDLDDRAIVMLREMGLQIVPTRLADASAAYEAQKIDGFMAIPMAALSFQWSAQVSYVTDLRVGIINACLLVGNRTFDKLPETHREALRAASAKLVARMDETVQESDDKLLSQLFARQGVKTVPLSESLRAEFFESARAARTRLGEKLVPAALLNRVLQILADYRAEHGLKGR